MPLALLTLGYAEHCAFRIPPRNLETRRTAQLRCLRRQGRRHETTFASGPRMASFHGSGVRPTSDPERGAGGFAKTWSRGADLNRRPADYESAALPTELPRLRDLNLALPRASVKRQADLMREAVHQPTDCDRNYREEDEVKQGAPELGGLLSELKLRPLKFLAQPLDAPAAVCLRCMTCVVPSSLQLRSKRQRHVGAKVFYRTANA